MAKHDVDYKDLDEVGRMRDKTISERYEKERQRHDQQSYGKSTSNNRKQQDGDWNFKNGNPDKPRAGDRIVKDFRELSRQQGPPEENPTYISGENVHKEVGERRYGDSISRLADEEYWQKDEDSSAEWQNDRFYQPSRDSPGDQHYST